MPHTHALILSTGDELIMGQLQDTNARWLAERLTERAIRPTGFLTVGDDLNALVDVLRSAAAQAPLVIMSGGLGPTDGDLTREALCKLTGDMLINDSDATQQLTARLKARGRPVSDRQLRQAHRPSRATCLPNKVGTAPGLWLTHNGTDIACLPGPPGELRPMWAESVVPRLCPDPGLAIRTHLIYLTGIPEADAADRIKHLTARGGPLVVNLTAHGGVLTVRARFEGRGASAVAAADARLNDAVIALHDALAPHVIADAPTGENTSEWMLTRAVFDRLTTQNLTLATVESCTGGTLAGLLTAIPGCSNSYLGGVVTYSNNLKTTFADVPVPTIAEHGAVSRETAAAMAAGGLSRTGADCTLAITGVAGPDGGTPGKPVGTVWIALAQRRQNATPAIDARRFLFPGDRIDVRARSCTSALAVLWFALGGAPAPRLLWQQDP